MKISLELNELKQMKLDSLIKTFAIQLKQMQMYTVTILVFIYSSSSLHLISF